MEHSNLYYMVQNVLVQLPLLLTIIVCAIMALVRWKRCPKVSMWVAISMVFLFLHTVMFAFVFAFGTDWLQKTFAFRPENSIIVLSFVYNSSLAIVVAILLIGVFTQRRGLSSYPQGRVSI